MLTNQSFVAAFVTAFLLLFLFKPTIGKNTKFLLTALKVHKLTEQLIFDRLYLCHFNEQILKDGISQVEDD